MVKYSKRFRRKRNLTKKKYYKKLSRKNTFKKSVRKTRKMLGSGGDDELTKLIKTTMNEYNKGRDDNDRMMMSKDEGKKGKEGGKVYFHLKRTAPPSRPHIHVQPNSFMGFPNGDSHQIRPAALQKPEKVIQLLRGQIGELNEPRRGATNTRGAERQVQQRNTKQKKNNKTPKNNRTTQDNNVYKFGDEVRGPWNEFYNMLIRNYEEAPSRAEHNATTSNASDPPYTPDIQRQDPQIEVVTNRTDPRAAALDQETRPLRRHSAEQAAAADDNEQAAEPSSISNGSRLSAPDIRRQDVKVVQSSINDQPAEEDDEERPASPWGGWEQDLTMYNLDGTKKSWAEIEDQEDLNDGSFGGGRHYKVKLGRRRKRIRRNRSKRALYYLK